MLLPFSIPPSGCGRMKRCFPLGPFSHDDCAGFLLLASRFSQTSHNRSMLQ